MRGRTLDNAFIILDEAQNTTQAQMAKSTEIDKVKGLGITAVKRPFRSDMPVWCRTEAMTGRCG